MSRFDAISHGNGGTGRKPSICPRCRLSNTEGGGQVVLMVRRKTEPLAYVNVNSLTKVLCEDCAVDMWEALQDLFTSELDGVAKP
jgi:hypothetical protein